MYSDALYLALPVLRSYFNWTYRETEVFFRDLFPRKPRPSFQSLHWYARKKLKEEILVDFLNALKEKLRPFLEEEALLILDSTGIPQGGKTRILRWMRDMSGCAWPSSTSGKAGSSSRWECRWERDMPPISSLESGSSLPLIKVSLRSSSFWNQGPKDTDEVLSPEEELILQVVARTWWMASLVNRAQG